MAIAAHASAMLWRWRHSPLHRRFSRWLGFNALITLACTLLLLLHFRSRPDPINPLLRGDSRHFKVARGTADQTWRTASREVISDSENPVMHDSGVVVLPNGVHMPRLGFGTAGLGGMTERATSWALQAGYRLLDSAQATEWYNEKAVGKAIRSSHIARDKLFIVSKLHPRHLGYEVTKQQFSTSLQDLGTSYLDLFLLHYPRCFPSICSNVKSAGSWQESWKALEELHDDLKIRAIGVSNFNEEELRELLGSARIKPSVVQRNSDPFSADVEIQAFCQKEGIQYMGYSSLGSQWLMRGYAINPVLNHPIIHSVAVAQACTSAQVRL
uniref:NADP-dependent oxidoreductase domain-containing protein n=1 Tax=Physcomitrium patens TaxID=3218 RepID=A0A7I4E8R9_PHYPA